MQNLQKKRTSVSFPITVSVSETDATCIRLTRHTDPGFSVELSGFSADRNGHQDLYGHLLSVLHAAGLAGPTA